MNAEEQTSGTCVASLGAKFGVASWGLNCTVSVFVDARHLTTFRFQEFSKCPVVTGCRLMKLCFDICNYPEKLNMRNLDHRSWHLTPTAVTSSQPVVTQRRCEDSNSADPGVILGSWKRESVKPNTWHSNTRWYGNALLLTYVYIYVHIMWYKLSIWSLTICISENICMHSCCSTSSASQPGELFSLVELWTCCHLAYNLQTRLEKDHC